MTDPDLERLLTYYHSFGLSPESESERVNLKSKLEEKLKTLYDINDALGMKDGGDTMSVIDVFVKKAEKWDKINEEPYHENIGLALLQEVELNKSLQQENQKLKEEILHLTALLNMPENSLQKTADDLLKRVSEKNNQINTLKEKLDRINTPEFLEKLSSIEHNQWTEWAYSLISAKESISKDRLDRWDNYMIDYEKLPEEIKEQDRKYSRLIIKEILKELES